MAEKDIMYYLMWNRVVGKKENGNYYMFKDGRWEPDTNYEILGLCLGYDPSEPAGSPYGTGDSDIMEEIEVISEKQAMDIINMQEQ